MLGLRECPESNRKVSQQESGRSASWWTPDCKLAHLDYQEAVEEHLRTSRAKKFRSKVAAVKREHWSKKVEDMRTAKDTYKLIKLVDPRKAIITPPLRYEGQFISDQTERATILQDCLLARYSASDDLPPCILSGEAYISGSDDLTELEVRACTIRCGNNSPGADVVSVALLVACWEYIGPHVTQLFRACFRLGYHPECFKLAEIVFPLKSGLDSSSVKGWRPISLLSCLGKVLERIMGRRMSHLAIVSDIVGHQQFGALSKRSSNDLVLCVVQYIKEAKSRGWASTFVTLDTQGLFDAVLYNRLICQM